MTAIQRDIACFLRSYVAQSKARAKNCEEMLESPWAELGLARTAELRAGYRFARSKATLRLGAFRYAVTDYGNAKFSDAYTLSFETLAHESGSPDKVFLLDEDKLTQLLRHLESLTGEVYACSETAGLKQLVRARTFSLDEALDLLATDYGFRYQRPSADSPIAEEHYSRVCARQPRAAPTQALKWMGPKGWPAKPPNGFARDRGKQSF